MNTWHELVDDIIKYNSQIKGIYPRQCIFLRNRESSDKKFFKDPFFVKHFYHLQGNYVRGMSGDMFRIVINPTAIQSELFDQIITPELLVRMLLEQS